MNSYNPAYKHIPSLDGIRGLAIVLVLIVHYFYAGPSIHKNPIPADLFIFGWTGVELFFVLSGFLITSILIRIKNEKRSFATFYINRASRILPVYLAFLFAVLLASIVGKPEILSSQLNNVRENFYIYFLYISNFSYLAGLDLSKADAIMGPAWSLAIEQQFYLIWPFIICALSIKNTKIMLVTSYLILVVSRFILSDYFHYNVIYHTTFLHFDGLAVGSLAALFYKNIIKHKKSTFLIFIAISSLLILTFIYAGSVHYKNKIIYTVGYPVICLFYCYLILTVITTKKASSFFESRVMVALGKYSYCIYLIHWPSLIITRIAIPEVGLTLWVLSFLCFTLIMVVAAKISFVFLERPASKLIRRLNSEDVR
ncbi:acyltransferase family protein [Kosakonia pseudosacchari]|uniref:acyltransferase family protein n=1 Tax=Kosakonia pseudosacchari TaxID=1646340 RepID=UPI0013565EBE|nr:acyltransferase [Kosakonia pseudosacchari]